MKLVIRRSILSPRAFIASGSIVALIAPAVFAVGGAFALAHCGGDGDVTLGDASTATDAASGDSSIPTDGAVGVTDARNDSTATDASADAARDSATADAGRDGSADSGRTDAGDAATDAGRDSSTSDSGSDSSTSDAGSDGSTTDAATDAAEDGGSDAASFDVIQNCLEANYADRTSSGATRSIPWGFGLGSAATRCIKVSAGQSVVWDLEDPQADFGTHPLVVPPTGAGDTPNPIMTPGGSGNSRTVTFANPGKYGYVCGNGHSGMLGAVWVVPN